MMLLALALLAGATAAGPSEFPIHVGQCQWVRGAFYVANGSGINRLWVRGTRHVLNLHDNDSDAEVPRAIKQFWKGRPFESRLWGDFYVCARARYIPGHMQRVRILRTRRTMIARR
jgi:hypothetical protein